MFLLLILNVYLFSGLDLISESFLDLGKFKLQLFIERFPQSEIFPQSGMCSPLLIQKVLFSNAIYKLLRGNCPGQKSVVTCSRKNLMGAVIRGSLIRGGSGENVLGTKVQEAIALGKFHDWGANVQGETIQG